MIMLFFIRYRNDNVLQGAHQYKLAVTGNESTPDQSESGVNSIVMKILLVVIFSFVLVRLYVLNGYSGRIKVCR